MEETEATQPQRATLASLVLLYSGVPQSPERGRLYPLYKEKVVIGSADNADIQLSPQVVEPYHAELRFEEKDWWLHDYSQSRNVCINGIPVELYSLQQDGQVLQIGGAIVKFLSGQGYESQCFADLYEKTTIDFLTQVYNKEFFHNTLEREIIRASRYKRDLSLILIDLDHFGLVNKQYGQLAGDAVLKEAAARLKQCMRTPDTLGRVGGEEFAAILPETNIEQARELAERLRQHLYEQPCSFHAHRLSVTLSAGVAAYQDKMSSKDLFEKTNHYLRHAKSQGRNQIAG